MAIHRVRITSEWDPDSHHGKSVTERDSSDLGFAIAFALGDHHDESLTCLTVASFIRMIVYEPNVKQCSEVYPEVAKHIQSITASADAIEKFFAAR